MKDSFVLIIGAQRANLPDGMTQCSLSVFDMRGNNGDGKVFRFITTGDNWRIISYVGTSFQLTHQFPALFEAMVDDQERWIVRSDLVVG